MDGPLESLSSSSSFLKSGLWLILDSWSYANSATASVVAEYTGSSVDPDLNVKKGPLRSDPVQAGFKTDLEYDLIIDLTPSPNLISGYRAKAKISIIR